MILLSCFEFVDIKLNFTANYFIKPIIRALYIEFMSVLVKLEEIVDQFIDESTFPTQRN